jgi:hypothetical protein
MVFLATSSWARVGNTMVKRMLKFCKFLTEGAGNNFVASQPNLLIRHVILSMLTFQRAGGRGENNRN